MSYQIKAPLPGTILEVKVVAGQEIVAGAAVVILEAMKMENEIPADFDGTVVKVLVEAGQTVSAGAALVEIEQ